LRGWVPGARSVLPATMGASLAFVESPIRAALIRPRLIKRLAELDARCDRVVVVAHSQGAAAMLDALGGIAESGRSHAVDAPLPETLVTYGAGINQLVSQRVISSGALDQLKTNPLMVATGTA